MKRLIATLATLSIALTISGTGAVSPVTHAAAAGTDPATWKPWYLTSADQLRLPAPPADDSQQTADELAQLEQLQSQRTKQIEKRIDFWNKGPVTTRWTQILIETFRTQDIRPPFAARAGAILHTAMFDATIAAYDSRDAYTRSRPSQLDPAIDPYLKGTGSPYPAVNAAIAGAAEKTLTFLFPNVNASKFTSLADEAVQSRLYAGVNYPSDVDAGRELGHKVADLAIEHAKHDNSNISCAQPDESCFTHGPEPEGEQYWQPTPPGYENPTGGPTGRWTPWLMATGDEARIQSGITPPPEYGSDAFLDELHEVRLVQEHLTRTQDSIAHFWDDGLGSYTPSGHWNSIAIDQLRSHDAGTNQATRALAALNAAEADAAIAFFEAKYLYWSVRPVTAMRRLCGDGRTLCTQQQVNEDPSLALYPDWEPLIATPPFPAYPGGHSTFSGAAGKILGKFFPDSRKSLKEQAEQAAMSRLYGGIHFRSDNEAGLRLGRYIAKLAIARSEADGPLN